QNLTLSSGSGTYSQTFTGTSTDAHTVTANSLTTGNASKIAFTQNSGAAAGNTASGLNIGAAQPTNTGNTTDLINVSVAGTNGTINGIAFTGTDSNFTNLIKATNFTVTSGGAVTAAGAINGLTLSSSSLQPSAAGALTVSANGSNALTLTGGATSTWSTSA